MKAYRVAILAAGGLAILILLAGCSRSSEQKVADAKADVVAAKADVKSAEADAQLKIQQEVARDEWLSFKSEKEAVIAANDTIIAAYRAKMTYANGKMRAQYDKNIDSLEVKNKELKVKLNDYTGSGKNAWEQYKGEFNQDLDRLGAALKNFTVDNKKQG